LRLKPHIQQCGWWARLCLPKRTFVRKRSSTYWPTKKAWETVFLKLLR